MIEDRSMTTYRSRLTATEARAAVRAAKQVILRVIVAPDVPERMLPVAKAHALDLLKDLPGDTATFTVVDSSGEYLWLGFAP